MDGRKNCPFFEDFEGPKKSHFGAQIKSGNHIQERRYHMFSGAILWKMLPYIRCVEIGMLHENHHTMLNQFSTKVNHKSPYLSNLRKSTFL